MTRLLPTAEYFAGLARKRMAAGVLLRDPGERILLVEPSYKPSWEIPGGVVEADESPWAAVTRELAEEVGLDRAPGRLLVVDHVPAREDVPEGVVFVFDGGVLETELSELTFPDGEILSAGFHTVEQARTLVSPPLADRLAAAVDAVREGVTALCEHGNRVA